jgi:hypothetical protein
MADNPMQRAHEAPKCGAKTRKGTPCQSPAIRGKKRCRMHGGRSPGPPKGSKNAWKHGRRSKAYMERKRQANQITKKIRALMEIAGS